MSIDYAKLLKNAAENSSNATQNKPIGAEKDGKNDSVQRLAELLHGSPNPNADNDSSVTQNKPIRVSQHTINYARLLENTLSGITSTDQETMECIRHLKKSFSRITGSDNSSVVTQKKPVIAED